MYFCQRLHVIVIDSECLENNLIPCGFFFFNMTITVIRSPAFAAHLSLLWGHLIVPGGKNFKKFKMSEKPRTVGRDIKARRGGDGSRIPSTDPSEDGEDIILVSACWNTPWFYISGFRHSGCKLVVCFEPFPCLYPSSCSLSRSSN